MPSNKRKTAFISGSAYEYGKFGDAGKTFIRDLTRALVRNNFRIVSGFGAGVGSYIVEGALHEIYLGKKELMTDQLQVFPFPATDHFLTGSQTSGELSSSLSPADTLENIRNAYRTSMISSAGVVIFLFGNKLEEIAVREADGMIREFEIARANNAILIPVGASGYIAERLWRMMMSSFDEYFESREKFELFTQLGDPASTPEELIALVIRIAG